MSKIFETQLECFTHVVNGNPIYLKDTHEETMGTEIRFVDGVLKAYLYGGWVFCPVNFENPKLFHA